jgi:tetratricopeptide (TPR) repeat protein
MMQYMAERFLYLPGAGFAWLAGAVVVWGYERNHRGTILVAVVILFWLGILTFFRLEVWRNEVAVFQSAVTETADTVLRPRRHLVNTWLEVGKHDAESLTLARQVWEQSRENPAVSTKDRQEDARRYALLLIKTGEEAEGVARMKQLLVDAPEYPTPAFDLGIWEGRRGHYAEALAWFERAMQGGGGDALPTTLYNRGVALRKLGREKEAADSFRQAVEAGASTPEVFHQWLAAVQALGQSAKAAEVRRLAQRYWPGQWTEGEAAEGGGSGSAPHQ